MKMLRLTAIFAAAVLCSHAKAQTSEAIATLTAVAQRDLALVTTAPTESLCAAPRITQDELSFLIEQVRHRTAQDVLLTARENTYVAHEMLRRANITETSRPYTYSLIMMALKDTTTLGAREILAYKFPSPSEYTQQVPAITPPGSPYGYPAVHATVVTTTKLLIEACTRNAQPELEDHSERVLNRRVRGGMDWPTGISAGQDLARKYLHLFAKSPEFLLRLELAQAEWK